MDGFPVNAHIAKRLGANVYYNRMIGHGLKPPHNLDDFTADKAWEGAKKSLHL